MFSYTVNKQTNKQTKKHETIVNVFISYTKFYLIGNLLFFFLFFYPYLCLASFYQIRLQIAPAGKDSKFGSSSSYYYKCYSYF